MIASVGLVKELLKLKETYCPGLQRYEAHKIYLNVEFLDSTVSLSDQLHKDNFHDHGFHNYDYFDEGKGLRIVPPGLDRATTGTYLYRTLESRGVGISCWRSWLLVSSIDPIHSFGFNCPLCRLALHPS